MSKTRNNITLSVVSHQQQQLVESLLNDLENNAVKNINILLTLNVDETLSFNPDNYSFPIRVIKNASPKGFGANHNQAFHYCDTPYFCVINPDIRLNADPFSTLISELENHAATLIAPMVLSPNSTVEDSVRKFPTFFSIIKKILRSNTAPDYQTQATIINPDWVGGMFMLFKAEGFKLVGGFDERYFLYYEDVDICRSLHFRQHKLIYTPHVAVIHEARRTSHKKIKYLLWHIKSMFSFFLKWRSIKSANRTNSG